MDRRTFLLALGGTAVAAALPQAAEAAPTWVRLGSRRVNRLLDVHRIAVGAGAGTFRRIRLRVRGNNLLMYRLTLRYANGRTEQLPVRALIPQGGYTRAIDLSGNRRFIRSVEFAYGKLPNGAGPTFVDLYGIR